MLSTLAERTAAILAVHDMQEAGENIHVLYMMN